MAKFVKHSNILGHCDCCQRQTHVVPQHRMGGRIGGTCQLCIQAAELENEHNDGHHEQKPCPSCPFCQRRPTESAIRDMVERVGVQDPNIRVVVAAALAADPVATPKQIRDVWAWLTEVRQ